MNYKLLQTRIDDALAAMVKCVPEFKKDGSNSQDFFCADVVGARKFVQNYGGYPRSEIAEINAQTNLQAQMALLQTLEDYSPKSNPNAGLTDAQIALSHRSKYQQAPSEMQAWLEGQIQLRDIERAKAVEAVKAVNIAKQKAAQPDKSVIVDPE